MALSVQIYIFSQQIIKNSFNHLSRRKMNAQMMVFVIFQINLNKK